MQIKILLLKMFALYLQNLHVIAQFHSGFQTNKNGISIKHNTSLD